MVTRLVKLFSGGDLAYETNNFQAADKYTGLCWRDGVIDFYLCIFIINIHKF